MKHLLTALIITLVFMPVRAQKSVMKTVKKVEHYEYQKVYKWEAYTERGVVIFGVNKSKQGAEAVIEDFTRRNWNTTARPLAHYIKEDIATTNDYFQKFITLFPKGYYVLSTTEIAALELMKKADIAAAAIYLEKCFKKNYVECIAYISELHNNSKEYRIID